MSFVMANGQQITRSVGFAIVRVNQSFTVDEVVFAEKGDLLLLGARSLEGLNLTVDSRKKKLVGVRPVACGHKLARLTANKAVTSAAAWYRGGISRRRGPGNRG